MHTQVTKFKFMNYNSLDPQVIRKSECSKIHTLKEPDFGFLMKIYNLKCVTRINI